MAARKKPTTKRSDASTKKAPRKKKPRKAPIRKKLNPSDGPGYVSKKGVRGKPRRAITDEKLDKLLQGIRLGLWPDRAARLAEINPSTLRSLRSENAEFREMIEKAEAEAQTTFHGRILRHTETQWTAAAWMLERRWPDEYAKRDPQAIVNLEAKGDVSVSVGPPVPEQDLGAYMRKLGELLDADE